MDRRYAPSRIAAVLQALRPDIMALQEVDSRRPHHEGLPQFKYFQQVTGLHAVAGPSVRDAHGEYGNLLLTRFPVTAVRPLDLTVAGREPRTAVDVDLDTPEGPFEVVALHVGLSKVERATQFHRLIEALGDLTKAGTPVLLMGDFNEWAPRTGTRLTAITAQFPSVISPRSFPAPAPLLPLDRIYAYPRPAEFRQVLPATPLVRFSSDHLPVAADLVRERGGERAQQPAAALSAPDVALPIQPDSVTSTGRDRSRTPVAQPCGPRRSLEGVRKIEGAMGCSSSLLARHEQIRVQRPM